MKRAGEEWTDFKGRKIYCLYGANRKCSDCDANKHSTAQLSFNPCRQCSTRNTKEISVLHDHICDFYTMAVFAPGSQEYMRLHADVFRSFHYHFDFSYNLEQNLGQLNMLVTSALRGLYKHIYFVAWVLKQLLPCQKDVQRLILQWIIGNNPGKRATDRLLKCTRQDWRSKSTNDGRIEFLEYEEG